MAAQVITWVLETVGLYESDELALTNWQILWEWSWPLKTWQRIGSLETHNYYSNRFKEQWQKDWNLKWNNREELSNILNSFKKDKNDICESTQRKLKSLEGRIGHMVPLNAVEDTKEYNKQQSKIFKESFIQFQKTIIKHEIADKKYNRFK